MLLWHWDLTVNEVGKNIFKWKNLNSEWNRIEQNNYLPYLHHSGFNSHKFMAALYPHPLPDITQFHLLIFQCLPLKYENPFFEPLSHIINKFPDSSFSFLLSLSLSIFSSKLSFDFHWDWAIIPQRKENGCCIGQNRCDLPQLFSVNFGFSF